jgi:hypothetical protein
MSVFKFTAILLVLLAGTLPACTQTAPPSPTSTAIPPTSTSTTPTPSPTVVSPEASTTQPPSNGTSPFLLLDPDAIEGLEDVIDSLGFALMPEYLPEGFGVSRADVSGGRARIIFGDTQDKLILAYPVEFSPGGGEVLTRPDDALVEVDVDGQPGFLMTGGWSDATIQQGPGINPADAVWDYERSFTLFYDYQLSGRGDIGIAVQALLNPSDWITQDEMIRIGESLAPAG